MPIDVRACVFASERASCSGVTDDRDWRYRRAVARVEGVVEEVVADFAVSYVGRPVQRRDILPPRPLPGVAWSIDGDLVVEFVHRDSGQRPAARARHRSPRRSQEAAPHSARRRHPRRDDLGRVAGDGYEAGCPAASVPYCFSSMRCASGSRT